MKLFKILLPMIIFVMFLSISTFSNNISDDSEFLEFASTSLKSRCDSAVAKILSNPKWADLADNEKLEVKDYKYPHLYNKTYLALLLGCNGPGEFILIDSANSQSKRLTINIPAKHARIGQIIDLNSDKVPELMIELSSGSHGSYLAFISIFEDSLSYITDENGYSQFFAPGGKYEIKDIDNDGDIELILKEMNWPEDKKNSDNYIIYKWNGSSFKKKM